ncbi:MAG: type III pantothenate kinase [Synergistaceae bacterium]|jgi:type III pantothenate kinase|nr:type III pantothenate kinase [Synergistaceae bacterium]
MLLVMDAGNTTTVVGVFDGEKLISHWRLSSILHTSDEFGIYLLTLLSTVPVKPGEIDSAILSSVVPPLDAPIREAIQAYFGVDCLKVDAFTDTGMEIRYAAPHEVGADRIVNAVAGRHKYGAPVIVADYGTAITLDVVSPDGAYLGGVIAPGLVTGVQALFSRAAKLPQVKLELPPSVIGRNTSESTQSGILHGNAGLTDRLVEKIREELGVAATVVATGGDAELMASISKTIERVDPWLTLDGLRIIHERNRKK